VGEGVEVSRTNVRKRAYASMFVFLRQTSMGYKF
jgi:hypothetical protein